MAGGQERVLRRRIKSVQSTKKITRAMELIAATRVVKAQQRAAAAKPYSRQITQVIENLAAGGTEVHHPLLREATDVRRVGFIAITSDRGLAGAYNSSVIRATEREVMAHELEGHDYSLVLIGKKAEGYFRFRNYRVDASFVGISDTPKYEDARAVAAKITELFVSGHVDIVKLIYTEFFSVGVQKVTVRRFLPLESVAVVGAEGQGDKHAAAAAEFEPSPEAVLEALLPRYVEARLFGALLESAASEHASRQRAMKSATDNAEELRIKLSRQMNRARQESITTEIMEIVGGAEAMRSGDESGIPGAVYIDAMLDPVTWPAQSGLAAASRFDELQSLQDELAGGRDAAADN
ncbi:MAG: F0F1 ATP synthase subunit gamma [Actinobacteria bacterium]|nr:F0F1 ATP synthase subunit gamma [Actinomycetota bacterium]MSY70869.1 F0F1 ATP synthase subunit gamma [Actinomycetota bacterium]